MSDFQLGSDRFYFLETPDGSDFLLRGMTGGGRLLMVFQTAESAQRLIDLFHIGGNMTVKERDVHQAHELFSRAQAMGVQFVAPILPGEEASSDLKFVPVQTILTALSGSA
jgi:hypothetical protein